MKNPAWIFMVVISCVLVACGGDTQPTSAKSSQTNSDQTTKTAPDIASATDIVSQTDVASAVNGQTTSQVQTTNTAKPKVQALSLEEGKARYEKTCKVCHDQGLLNAPKLTATADWAKRLEKGVDTLHAHSAKGFGKMPAQATGDVSEAEVYAAVDYMISQVKK